MSFPVQQFLAALQPRTTAVFAEHHFWCSKTAFAPAAVPPAAIALMQNSSKCSVILIWGTPKPRAVSETLYVGPCRGARGLARAPGSGSGRTPGCSTGGTFPKKLTLGGERSSRPQVAFQWKATVLGRVSSSRRG